MSIGTAKPTNEELAAAEHHFIDSHSISEPVSAGQYEKLALTKLKELYVSNDMVILTGGSGLFIDALCDGFNELPKIPEELRSELNSIYESEGLEPMQKRLQSIDKDYYQKMDAKNPRRIIRALELCLVSGKTMAQLQNKATASRPFSTIRAALNMDRENLYQRINKRVDLMIQNGLIAEVEALKAYKDLNALRTVGYQEVFDYFEGKQTLETTIELIKRNSRRYAKRQLTWLNRNDRYAWFESGQTKALIQHFEKKML